MDDHEHINDDDHLDSFENGPEEPYEEEVDPEFYKEFIRKMTQFASEIGQAAIDYLDDWEEPDFTSRERKHILQQIEQYCSLGRFGVDNMYDLTLEINKRLVLDIQKGLQQMLQIHLQNFPHALSDALKAEEIAYSEKVSAARAEKEKAAEAARLEARKKLIEV
jgi:hypothetical protein